MIKNFCILIVSLLLLVNCAVSLKSQEHKQLSLNSNEQLLKLVEDQAFKGMYGTPENIRLNDFTKKYLAVNNYVKTGGFQKAFSGKEGYIKAEKRYLYSDRFILITYPNNVCRLQSRHGNGTIFLAIEGKPDWTEPRTAIFGQQSYLKSKNYQYTFFCYQIIDGHLSIMTGQMPQNYPAVNPPKPIGVLCSMKPIMTAGGSYFSGINKLPYMQTVYKDYNWANWESWTNNRKPTDKTSVQRWKISKTQPHP